MGTNRETDFTFEIEDIDKVKRQIQDYQIPRVSPELLSITTSQTNSSLILNWKQAPGTVLL